MLFFLTLKIFVNKNILHGHKTESDIWVFTLKLITVACIFTIVCVPFFVCVCIYNWFLNSSQLNATKNSEKKWLCVWFNNIPNLK